MIGQFDLERAGKRIERPSEPDVFMAWLGIARGMIVNQQQRGRSVVQRPLYEKPVAAIDPVTVADAHDFVANIRTSCVQGNHEQDFVLKNPDRLAEKV
jgi:hypothetical protein